MEFSADYKVVARRLGQHDRRQHRLRTYQPQDFVSFPPALNAFTDCHLATFQKLLERPIAAGRVTNDAIRECETNDNNVVKGSHVADYQTLTQQNPREIAFAMARSPRGTSATESINTM
jgi:hypothetical protein